MNILIIGAAGFLGQHIMNELGQTENVVGLDLTRPPANLEQFDWITGSISDTSLIASVAASCDATIFLANASLPGSSQGDFAREAEAHVSATLRVAETCKDNGIERFIFASSGGTVYGSDVPENELLKEGDVTKPRNGYGVSKLAIEHYLRLMGTQGRMKTISLRISNPYGVGQRSLRAQGIVAAAMQHAMEETVMPIWGDGTVQRDFVYVEDVAKAFSRGLAYDGSCEVFNIGSGLPVSINKIIKETRLQTKRDLKVKYMKDRPIDVHRNVLSIDLAKSELNWEPEVNLADGLKRTASWWSELYGNREKVS